MLPTPIYRTLAGLVSPAGTKGRLSIVIYHRVLPATDPIFPNEVTAERFDAQMGLLKQAFNVLPLPDAIARLRSGTLPARTACVTFDDGYADNVTHALPILQKHGLPATFFIATAYLDGGRMFNDTVIEAIRASRHPRVDLSSIGFGEYDLGTPEAKRLAIQDVLPKIKYLPVGEREEVAAQLARQATDQALPGDLMMSTAQLKALHGAGMEIGGHTHHHPILARLDAASARAEIAAGVDQLEQALGDKIRVFAYPNGVPGIDYLPQQAELLKGLGLVGAVSTQWGVANGATDPFQLPRFNPWSPKTNRYLPMLIRNLTQVV